VSAGWLEERIDWGLLSGRRGVLWRYVYVVFWMLFKERGRAEKSVVEGISRWEIQPAKTTQSSNIPADALNPCVFLWRRFDFLAIVSRPACEWSVDQAI